MTRPLRTFRLSWRSPFGLQSTELTAATWADLQAELRAYAAPEIASALDLAWVRPEPLTRGEWAIEELHPAPALAAARAVLAGEETC